MDIQTIRAYVEGFFSVFNIYPYATEEERREALKRFEDTLLKHYLQE